MASESTEEVVELPLGERHALSLPGLGTAGYQWVADVKGAGGVAEVEPVGSEAPTTNAVGASASEKFEIRATRRGEATVRFEQRRPWEADEKSPAREHTVRVRVI